MDSKNYFIQKILNYFFSSLGLMIRLYNNIESMSAMKGQFAFCGFQPPDCQRI